MSSNQTYDASNIRILDLKLTSLKDVIGTLEERLMMFLPEKHIMYLDTFLMGYEIGKGRAVEDGELSLSGFNRFIEAKYEIKTTHGWARNLNHMSFNPHDACDMFFEEFREYAGSIKDD